MGINIRSTIEVPLEASKIFLVADFSLLSDFQFSGNEIDYINRKKAEEKERDLFIFNRYDFLLVVIIPELGIPITEAAEKIRRNSALIQKSLKEEKFNRVALIDLVGSKDFILALAEGLSLSCYLFDKYKSKQENPESLEIEVISRSFTGCEVTRLRKVVEAVFFARDLVNEPGAFLTANRIGEIVSDTAKKHGFTAEVYNKEKIEEVKMGGLLGVNRGSVEPPTFSILQWKPDQAINSKPYVVIGKGVTFDTGGINLKTAPGSIDTMKCDMSGAATVLALLAAVSANQLPVHVIGLIPATDNRLGGNAMVPGDILTMHDGTTVEIINTDAEGRLILADAISYARGFDPGLIIDLATLTGSAAMAIGTHGMVGMGTANKEVMENLTVAGEATGERIAWFPFWSDYDEALKSEVADMKNLGGREAGAITAGKFLSRFTSAPFIHLDIAGPAYLTTRANYRGIGGTGVGVRLLYKFFESLVSPPPK